MTIKVLAILCLVLIIGDIHPCNSLLFGWNLFPFRIQRICPLELGIVYLKGKNILASPNCPKGLIDKVYCIQESLIEDKSLIKWLERLAICKGHPTIASFILTEFEAILQKILLGNKESAS